MDRFPAVVLALTTLACASHDAKHEAPPTPDQVAAVESFLFVQNANSGTFDGERLTLDGVGTTIFFSDRPYRVYGHTKPDEFVAAWKRGPNSFASDPPNAILSLIGEKHVQSCEVELLDPRYSNGNFSYRVKVENGTIPAKFEEASLFIDNDLWAAVGGLAAGHLLTRRHDEQQASAYAMGQASAQQTPSYYYQAAPASAPVAPPPPAPPPPPQASVARLISQATAGMQAYAQSASPQDAQYVQKLIQTLNSVAADYQKVAN